MKSLHPAATQKPHPQPRAHSKSRLLLLCTSRSNGYPRRGLGYCRERGSCGEACGAPKGGFNCLEGRERKPRHPLPGASARPRAGERGIPLALRAVDAHGKEASLPTGPARVHPAGARGPRQHESLSLWGRPPGSLLREGPYSIRRPGLLCLLGSRACTAHPPAAAGQTAGLGLSSQ